MVNNGCQSLLLPNVYRRQLPKPQKYNHNLRLTREKHPLDFVKVKGHGDNEFNNYVDKYIRYHYQDHRQEPDVPLRNYQDHMQLQPL